MSNSALMLFLQAEKQGRYGIPITFPATPYQLLDVKDRARVQEGDRLRCEVSHFEPFTFIFAFIEESPCPEQMIALAQRLSQLDETGQIAFEGLVAKENAMGLGENPLERLITLAYNTDDCDVYLCHGSAGRRRGYPVHTDPAGPQLHFHHRDIYSCGDRAAISDPRPKTPKEWNAVLYLSGRILQRPVQAKVGSPKSDCPPFLIDN